MIWHALIVLKNNLKKASFTELVFFYTSLAYEGLHNTQCYIDDIASNSIESRKHEEYNILAKNTSQNCQ